MQLSMVREPAWKDRDWKLWVTRRVWHYQKKGPEERKWEGIQCWPWALLIKSSFIQIKTRLILIPNHWMSSIYPSGIVPKAHGQKPILEISGPGRPRMEEVTWITYWFWVRRNCFRGLARTRRIQRHPAPRTSAKRKVSSHFLSWL